MKKVINMVNLGKASAATLVLIFAIVNFVNAETVNTSKLSGLDKFSIKVYCFFNAANQKCSPVLSSSIFSNIGGSSYVPQSSAAVADKVTSNLLGQISSLRPEINNI